MKHKILFLAANPIGLTARKLDEEARSIQEELQLASQGHRFEFVPSLAARPMDFLRALRRIRPSIVHFVGHAQAGGIYLTDDAGQPMQVTRDALHATLGAAGQSVQIVVLNGCATEDLAQALCDFVPVCIGTAGKISDEAASAFSVGFYGALASSESVARACLQGKAAMHLAVTGDHSPPLLRNRFDIDPEQFVLASLDSMAAAAPGASLVAAVLERYRTRKRGSFQRWDLRAAGPIPTAGSQPTSITIDDMYVPLRFGSMNNFAGADLGTQIRPTDLLDPRKPQIVIGATGSGKTTWMKWTFEHLIQDPRAVPFFVELRTIASAWKVPRDASRLVESYLADELIGCGASDPNAIVAAILANKVGPRPVILIDGWDEIGDHGERLRARLVEFCHGFPHVVVVVSSRPYGYTRPAGAEGFETTFIQPLSDDDIRLLSNQIHRNFYSYDESTAALATEEFITALDAAPDARALAGTVLLLIMMLLLSREGPLPDRRHKLYTACLKNMLLHRVKQRERDGVIIDVDQQWRPESHEERLHAVAELAYRMQTEGYEKSRRAPTSQGWSETVDLLGGRWTQDQRERFLRWLLASTGVLIDLADGSIRFAHLSFQEHLAAYHLFITGRDRECVDLVQAHMNDLNWWETLRLWTGLLSDDRSDKLSPVLDVLRAGERTFWLAGLMFADGAGCWSDFDAWTGELPTHLSNPFASGEDCALAWGACKQKDRRGRVATILAAARWNLHWLAGAWHARWCDLSKLEVPPAPALLTVVAPLDSATSAARSRVLHGAVAGWPDGGELAMLRLWPSTRAVVSAQLQAAVSLGANSTEIAAIFAPLLIQSTQSWSITHDWRARLLVRELSSNLSKRFNQLFDWRFGRNFSRRHGRHFGRRLGRDLARYLIQGFGQNLARDLGRRLVEYFNEYHSREFTGWHFGHDSGFDFGRSADWRFFRKFAHNFDHDFSRKFGHELGLPKAILARSWFSIFAVLEARSAIGRASMRATLAHGRIFGNVPLMALFRAACRTSFAPGNENSRIALARACNDFDGAPLWPALARHVARVSTTKDRALLMELARHPERREPPLAWGLQHYVRGDLVLSDDSVVTLDELCAQAGLSALPLLEDMPDELNV